MFIEIGSYEAKTKLPELLREVQAGQCFTITLCGKPVASLVPCTSATDHQATVNEMKTSQGLRGFPQSLRLVLDASMALA